MKKQLLQEAEIRKMMKFANIGALTDGFVERLNEQEEVEEPEDEMGGEDLEAVEDEPVDMDVPEDEVDVEGGAEAGEEVLDAVKGVVDNLKLALSAAGPEGQAAADAIFVEGGEEEGVEDLGGLGGEEEMDLGADVEAPMPEPMEEPAPEDEEMALQEFQMVDDEAIEEETLNEVARRVARRLRDMKRQEDTL